MTHKSEAKALRDYEKGCKGVFIKIKQHQEKVRKESGNMLYRDNNNNYNIYFHKNLFHSF